MEEIRRLQEELKRVQQQKVVSFRLLPANLVEIIDSLKKLDILDVIHTLDGKEYLTRAHLRKEVLNELERQQGRVDSKYLPSLLNVDLTYVLEACRAVVDKDIQFVNGELISDHYIKRMAEEINEILKDVGKINVVDLTVHFQLNSTIVNQAINRHINTIIKAKFDGEILITPEYEEEIKAVIRGTFVGMTVPAHIQAQVAPRLGLSESVVTSVVETLIRENRISGKIVKGSFHPSSYSKGQQDVLENFFHQNRFMTYNHCRKLGMGGSDIPGFLLNRFGSSTSDEENDKRKGGHKGSGATNLHTMVVASDVVQQVDSTLEEGISEEGFSEISSESMQIPLTEEDTMELMKLLSSVTGESHDGDYLAKSARSTPRSSPSRSPSRDFSAMPSTVPNMIVYSKLINITTRSTTTAASNSAIAGLTLLTQLNEVPSLSPSSIDLSLPSFTGPLVTSVLTPSSLVTSTQKRLGVPLNALQMLLSSPSTSSVTDRADNLTPPPFFTSPEMGEPLAATGSSGKDTKGKGKGKGKKKGKDTEDFDETEENKANEDSLQMSSAQSVSALRTPVDPSAIQLCRIPFSSAYGLHSLDTSRPLPGDATALSLSSYSTASSSASSSVELPLPPTPPQYSLGQTPALSVAHSAASRSSGSSSASDTSTVRISPSKLANMIEYFGSIQPLGKLMAYRESVLTTASASGASDKSALESSSSASSGKGRGKGKRRGNAYDDDDDDIASRPLSMVPLSSIPLDSVPMDSIDYSLFRPSSLQDPVISKYAELTDKESSNASIGTETHFFASVMLVERCLAAAEAELRVAMWQNREKVLFGGMNEGNGRKVQPKKWEKAEALKPKSRFDEENESGDEEEEEKEKGFDDDDDEDEEGGGRGKNGKRGKDKKQQRGKGGRGKKGRRGADEDEEEEELDEEYEAPSKKGKGRRRSGGKGKGKQRKEEEEEEEFNEDNEDEEGMGDSDDEGAFGGASQSGKGQSKRGFGAQSSKQGKSGSEGEVQMEDVFPLSAVVRCVQKAACSRELWNEQLAQLRNLQQYLNISSSSFALSTGMTDADGSKQASHSQSASASASSSASSSASDSLISAPTSASSITVDSALVDQIVARILPQLRCTFRRVIDGVTGSGKQQREDTKQHKETLVAEYPSAHHHFVLFANGIITLVGDVSSREKEREREREEEKEKEREREKESARESGRRIGNKKTSKPSKEKSEKNEKEENEKDEALELRDGLARSLMRTEGATLALRLGSIAAVDADISPPPIVSDRPDTMISSFRSLVNQLPPSNALSPLRQMLSLLSSNSTDTAPFIEAAQEAAEALSIHIGLLDRKKEKELLRSFKENLTQRLRTFRYQTQQEEGEEGAEGEEKEKTKAEEEGKGAKDGSRLPSAVESESLFDVALQLACLQTIRAVIPSPPHKHMGAAIACLCKNFLIDSSSSPSASAGSEKSEGKEKGKKKGSASESEGKTEEKTSADSKPNLSTLLLTSHSRLIQVVTEENGLKQGKEGISADSVVERKKAFAETFAQLKNALIGDEDD